MILNDVLILGDSFCADRSYETDWPKALTKKLTNSDDIPRGHGFAGCSWWSVRKLFMKEIINVPKVIIFAHTEPQRIPSDFDHSLNSVTVSEHDRRLHQPDGTNKQMSKTMALAGRLYYEQLISFDFHEWAVTQWFKEIDEVIGSISGVDKVIHLFSFPGNYTNYTFKYGVTIDDSLFKYHKNNKTRNHFTPEENVKLANNIYSIIDNYPGNGIRYYDSIL
jgi:hypothetical protein